MYKRQVYGDRAESELMEMCTQIRESKETVENYEKEILALKGIVAVSYTHLLTVCDFEGI